MIIPNPDEIENSDFDEIISEGMMEVDSLNWIPIEVSVTPQRETEKAYYARVAVYEVDDFGRCDDIYPEKLTWIPKSMSGNPWWICSNIFDNTGKVANRRFDEY